MSRRIEFVYAQARVQARHGGWTDAAAWQALEASHTAGHCLALARAGVFAPWVDGLAETDDVHRVERHFRARWRAHVDEVARWLPGRWRPALRWFGLLGELPLVDALRREGHVPPWLRDARLAGAAAAAARADEGAAVDDDLGALFAIHEGPVVDTATRWRSEWTRRLPADAGAASALDLPARWLLPRLHDAQAPRGAAPPSALHALQRLLRRHAATPVAVFAHLALVALLLERLRGALVARLLFERAGAVEAA